MIRQHKHRPSTERGSALVTALLVMLIVVLVSTGMALSTRGGERAATAFSNQQTSFEIAIAGLETAREFVRYQRFSVAPAADFSAVLKAAANNTTTLVDSTQLSIFGTTNGFTKDSSLTNTIPLVAPTVLNGGSYQVFVTNSSRNGELVTSTNDKDDTVTLTSFGSGPNSIGFSVVQGVYAPDPRLDVPRLPALLTMPGRTIARLDLPNSNASTMDGNNGASPPTCYATLGITMSGQAPTDPWGTIDTAMGNRDNNYHSCNPSGGSTLSGMNSVDNFISGNNPYTNTNNTPVFGAGSTNLTSVSYLNGLVTQLSAAGVADYVGVDTGSVNLGTAAAPRVNVINGNFSLGANTNGYGILVVTGILSMNGTPGFHGVIYVIGAGRVDRVGGGNGVINCGGMLLANTNAPDSVNPALVGPPWYQINGGGTSDFYASCPANEDGDLARFGRALNRLSFQQLR